MALFTVAARDIISFLFRGCNCNPGWTTGSCTTRVACISGNRCGRFRQRAHARRDNPWYRIVMKTTCTHKCVSSGFVLAFRVLADHDRPPCRPCPPFRPCLACLRMEWGVLFRGDPLAGSPCAGICCAHDALVACVGEASEEVSDSCGAASGFWHAPGVLNILEGGSGLLVWFFFLLGGSGRLLHRAKNRIAPPFRMFPFCGTQSKPEW